MNKKFFNVKKILPLLLLLLLIGCNLKEQKIVYVAWNNKQDSISFVSTLRAIEATGAKVKILEMAKSYDLMYDENNNLINAEDEYGALTEETTSIIKKNLWHNSNVEELMKDVEYIVFPGGFDISPSLYGEKHKVIEGEMEFSGERDVSDYMLLSYCIEKNIRTFTICRGMQMLSVVSGCKLIQDIPSYLNDSSKEFDYIHRDKYKKDFVYHDIEVLTEDSFLYKIMKKKILKGVPSWHHQSTLDVNDTNLVVTATTKTGKHDIIEAVERKDKSFIWGVQFHPEIAVCGKLDNNLNSESMDYDDAILFFSSLTDDRLKKE